MIRYAHVLILGGFKAAENLRCHTERVSGGEVAVCLANSGTFVPLKQVLSTSKASKARVRCCACTCTVFDILGDYYYIYSYLHSYPCVTSGVLSAFISFIRFEIIYLLACIPPPKCYYFYSK